MGRRVAHELVHCDGFEVDEHGTDSRDVIRSDILDNNGLAVCKRSLADDADVPDHLTNVRGTSKERENTSHRRSRACRFGSERGKSGRLGDAHGVLVDVREPERELSLAATRSGHG